MNEEEKVLWFALCDILSKLPDERRWNFVHAAMTIVGGEYKRAEKPQNEKA